MNSIPRGIRNNNPGNIRWGSEWQGIIPSSQRTDNVFCQFISPQYGIRAMIIILRNYQIKHALKNLSSIINRWAPSSENNTRSYIDHVVKFMGIGEFDEIDLTIELVMKKLIKAIIYHENGCQPYEDCVFNKALGMI